ncbi:unnamed protein product [Cyclocybe aegerita]|uniref:Cytochrome P450 n=1 Tax=Cyclocybe aegerita TaxID=1973307 RepID=A0A8S0WXS1_CYCAE|nr:unnamed protein product [Cyclocybe aegerita]
MLKASHRFLRHVLDSQDDIVGDIRHLSGEIILSSAYGLDIASKSDKYIRLAKEGVKPALPALIPGTYWVDFMPFLKYVPEWFPGAGFRRKANEWKRLTLAMRDTPFEVAKNEIEKGLPPPSFCLSSLQALDERLDIDQQEQDIKDAAGTLYGGGSDTTMASVANCILSLLNHPEALKKAHDEIDRVLKPGTLPDLEDEPSLPYITAIVKESSRWNISVPLGSFHPTCQHFR